MDYTDQKPVPVGVSGGQESGNFITYTETPDVLIARTGWTQTHDGQMITLTMKTQAEFRDYAIALWNVPMAYTNDRSRIKTNAKDFILVKNTAGQCHLVLFFDLKPNAQIQILIAND